MLDCGLLILALRQWWRLALTTAALGGAGRLPPGGFAALLRRAGLLRLGLLAWCRDGAGGFLVLVLVARALHLRLVFFRSEPVALAVGLAVGLAVAGGGRRG